MATFTSTRLMTFASLGILLAGCSTVRLEDVPSASAIDAAAAKTQANLLIPPGMDEVPAPEPPVANAVSEPAEPPVAPGTVWRVRYSLNGYDAENAAGDTCSGWGAYGDGAPRAGQSIKMACSDGQLVSLLIGEGQGQTHSGAVIIGKDRQSAVIHTN